MALDADKNGHFNKREFHHALVTLGLYILNVTWMFYSYEKNTKSAILKTEMKFIQYVVIGMRMKITCDHYIQQVPLNLQVKITFQSSKCYATILHIVYYVLAEFHLWGSYNWLIDM